MKILTVFLLVVSPLTAIAAFFSPLSAGRSHSGGVQVVASWSSSLTRRQRNAAAGDVARALSLIATPADSAVASSTRLLVSNYEAAAAASSISGVALLPVAGSSLIMLTIVALLYTWEKSVEWARESVPVSLLPVVESILAEIGGLGFIGLVLQTILSGTSKEILEEVSVEFFGEGEILVETFEFLHTAFFQVGVGFFVAAGAMVAVGLKKLDEIDTIEELQVDAQTGECTVTSEKLAKFLPITSDVDLDKAPELDGPSTLWDEIFMPAEERAAKTLLIRSRLVERFDLPEAFRVEEYIRASFAENMKEMVELSPLTWIYLIPFLALANSIDLSHEVINAASPNASDSAGFFFSTPWAIIPSTVSVLISLIWGIWNCWKITLIKYMVFPRLGRDTVTGSAKILPAPVESELARASFSSSPAWVQPIERIWSEPAQNPSEELFGIAGASGLELYRNSIKFQTWLCITHIVFFGTQIVPRDLDAILTGAVVGDPEHLMPELVLHGGFVLLSLSQLIFVAPRAFWNYCLVTRLLDDEEEFRKACASKAL